MFYTIHTYNHDLVYVEWFTWDVTTAISQISIFLLWSYRKKFQCSNFTLHCNRIGHKADTGTNTGHPQVVGSNNLPVYCSFAIAWKHFVAIWNGYLWHKQIFRDLWWLFLSYMYIAKYNRDFNVFKYKRYYSNLEYWVGSWNIRLLNNI